MPAHESIGLRVIGVFLLQPLPGFKLNQKAGISAGFWLLPMLAMAFLPKLASAGFVTARSYPAGIAPVSVAVGDFNGDGIADLAVLGNPSLATLPPGLYVLLGNGDGSFGAPQQYPVGSNAQAIAVGDFNGDGMLDLVVSNTSAGTLSVFLGNGDGSFQAARIHSLGAGPTGVAVGDFDGDGILDLAVAISNGTDDNGIVSIWLGNGDGTFRAQHNFAVGILPWSVVAADFNGDGILDLAVVNSNWQQPGPAGSVSILAGSGDGTFQAAVNYPVGAYPQALVAGDFNGDGNLDLAVSNIAYPGTGWSLSLLLGKGDGSFQAALNYDTPPPADDSDFYSLAVADFNRDGHLDLAMTCRYGVMIWLGQGDGSFQIGPTYNVGTSSVAVADFNQDGQADLVVANADVNAVRILLGRGDGTFQAAPSYPNGLENRYYASSVAVGDFNGDGIPDLAAGSIGSDTGSVEIWLGNGDGTFQKARNHPTDANAIGVAVADFNGDGQQDLLVTVNFAGANRPYVPPLSGLRVWLGNGDGGFATAFRYDTVVGFYPAALGDFNGDGIPDVVAPNYGFSMEGNTVTAFLGKGDGSLGGKKTYPVLMTPSAVAVADFNGDGRLDLAVAAAGGLSILLGNGDGTFQAAHNYAQLTGDSLAVADFNGDGVLDLVIWKAGFLATPGTLQILLGHGDGTFQPGMSYTAGTAGGFGRYISAGLAAVDFNGDGILDLAITDSFSGSVSLLLGKGDGTFAEPQTFAVGSDVNALAVADFNGDGNLDIAVACGSTVTILLNDGQWSP
jgi:hypothetical protein